MTFGERVKQVRLEKGLTIADIAQQVGVSEATVSRWENNIIGANHNYVVPLCKVLGTTPNDLLGWENVSAKKTEKVKVKKVNKSAQTHVETILQRKQPVHPRHTGAVRPAAGTARTRHSNLHLVVFGDGQAPRGH